MTLNSSRNLEFWGTVKNPIFSTVCERYT